jgi:glucose-1-phosphate adenylyltransferase
MDGRLILLAGGISSRMKNSADNAEDSHATEDVNSKAKSMIRLGQTNRPFLDYLLINVEKAGYRDVTIVINEYDDSIKDYYGNNEANEFNSMTISYAVQTIPAGRDKPLGTADALLAGLLSRPDWKGKKFTVCNSDNLYSQKAFRLMLESNHENAMVDYARDGFNFEAGRVEKFALTKKDSSNFLIDIVEKPSDKGSMEFRSGHGSDGVSMNIWMFSYDIILPFLESVELHPVRKEKEIPAAVKNMIKDNPEALYAYPLSEHVPDLTSRDDIELVKKYIDAEFNSK